MSQTQSQSLIYREHCPACGDTSIKKLFVAKDYTVSHQGFEVWGCSNCGLRFTQAVPNEEEIGAYYQSEDYISHSNTNQGIVNRLYQQVRRITLQQKRRNIIRWTKQKTGTLLDIGCGTGDFAGTMKAAGWETVGLEPDPGARRLGEKNYGLTMFPPTHLFELAPDRFDVITMWHVLEHVHQLDAYLSQIKKLLKPDGWLLIAVPNYQSNDAAYYGDTWAAYDVPRHLYHFSPLSIDTLVQKYGFHVERHRRMPFDAFYVSMLSEQYRRGKSGLPNLFGGVWHGLRSYIGALANPKRGSSVLYVIRQKG